MTCPTLEAWGAAVLPRIFRSNLLIPAQSYGMETGLQAYILAPDAAQYFDRIISDHVRHLGGLSARQRAILTNKEAA